MKVLILAGGYGSRLGEETTVRPKPLVEIGGRPIIWHIMKHYSHHGLNEFIILLGYKGYMIKEFFANYQKHMSDMCLDFINNTCDFFHNKPEYEIEPWKIDLVYTGEGTMTGGRLKRVFKYLGNEDTFCLTYGDGVSNIDITKEMEYHKSHNKIATVGAVPPPARFGALKIDDNKVTEFIEKPMGDNAYISGGFFIFNKKIFDYLYDDDTFLEKEPLYNLAKEGELMAFKHNGFWQCMDTPRDKALLEEMWNKGNPPWKTWK